MRRVGMLSRLLVVGLVLEVGLAAGVFVLLRWVGAPVWAGLLAVVGLFAVVRLGIAVDMFRQSERHRMERGAEQGLKRLGWVRLVLAEYLALMRLFSWHFPFEWALHRQDCRTGEGTVVLCVHGYVCNSAYWGGLRRALRRAGLCRVYTMNLDPTFGSIDDFGELVARRVEAIREATGVDKVVLIGHSMGGLVCRCYVQRHGGDRYVSKIITLGTPHHGTVSALRGRGENARQMRPGNAWLEALNSDAPVDVPIVSIYTFHDNVVYPQDSAVLPGARNVGLPGIGHLELAFSRRVQDLIVEELRAA